MWGQDSLRYLTCCHDEFGDPGQPTEAATAHRNNAKPYQVRQVRAVILKYKLGEKQ